MNQRQDRGHFFNNSGERVVSVNFLTTQFQVISAIKINGLNMNSLKEVDL